MKTKRLCIFGAGGAAKDTYTIVHALGLQDEFLCFLESDDIWTDRKVLGQEVRPLSFFNPDVFRIVVALGDSAARKTIVESLPPGTRFFSLIHPSVILSPWVEIGEGSIILPGCILTCDIKIGKHAYINIGTTISHDCKIGDYFTASPAVNISGNCTIGDNVFIGINSSVREKISIANNVFIGMSSAVVKNIDKPGKYFGIPAKKII